MLAFAPTTGPKKSRSVDVISAKERAMSRPAFRTGGGRLRDAQLIKQGL